MTAPLLALIALAGLCAAFALCFVFARRIDNFGIVDVAWSYAFAALAVFYAATASGWLPRRLLLAALVTIWSLRLGTHLALRVARHHPEEDTRYRQLRLDWSARFLPKMAGFFQLQAASVVLLALPFLLSARNPSPSFAPLEFAGALLWLVALSGEALADAQLAAFKRHPSHRDRVCDVGLWRYSRHPNYFFESLIWFAYALFAAASPWGWLGFLSPAIILYLLLRVTGVPLAEAQSLRSRGDAYRAYQRRTSPFLPLPPRRH